MIGVNPARAGMILRLTFHHLESNRKPRASGDDPQINVHLFDSIT